MSRKKKKQSGNPGGPPPPQPPRQPSPPAEDDTTDTRTLPATLKKALRADYSQVLRIRNVQWLIVIAVIVGALALGYHLSAVFVPLLVALALAYILNPLVARLQKKGLSRTKAVLMIFLLFIAISACVGVWFTASIVRDVQGLSSQARELWDDFQENQDEWVASWNESVPVEQLRIDPTEGSASDQVVNSLFPSESKAESPEAGMARAQMATARADLLAAFQKLDASADLALDAKEAGTEFEAMDTDASGRVTPSEWFVYFGASAPTPESRVVGEATSSATDKVIDWAGSGLLGLLTILLWITLIPIYTWYFMVGFDKVVAKGREYLPGAHRPRIEKVLKEIDAMLKAFFRGRIVIVFIIIVLTTIVYLAFGVQYAVLLGLMAGLGVLIPYASMLVSWVPAMILMAINGDTALAIIGMSLFFHAIQAFEQYFLTPKLLGNAVELHPVTLLVGVFVMGSLFGIFGALLAVPLTAIAKTLGREFLLPYFKSLANEKPKTAES
jgi:predicted PurR-regulated permease PerM